MSSFYIFFVKTAYRMSYPYGGVDSIALGAGAGSSSQAASAIAIGTMAGNQGQGANSIAIGYKAGSTSHPASTIMLNATGVPMTGSNSAALYIAPIRNFSTTTLLQYNPTTAEIGYSNALNADVMFMSSLTVNSTALISTLNTVNVNYSILTGSTLTVNSTALISTLNAVNVNYNTLIGSTLTVNSTATTSTLNAVNVNYNTLIGSTLTVNSTATTSTLNAVNVNYRTLIGSTLTVNSTATIISITAINIGYSTLTGSTLTVNTSVTNSETVNSTLTTSTITSRNIGIGTATANQLLTIYNPNGGNSVSITASTGNTNYMSFLSGTTPYGYIGFDNSAGSGLFGSGAAYGFCVGTPQSTSMVLCTNNVVRMNILNSGNVGIGPTINPIAPLHVINNNGLSGTPGNIIALFQAANMLNVNDSGIAIGSVNGNTPYIADYKSNGLRFYSQNTNIMTLTSSKINIYGAAYFSGNVGIGNTNPQCSLQVSNNFMVGNNVSGTAINYAPISVFTINSRYDGENAGCFSINASDISNSATSNYNFRLYPFVQASGQVAYNTQVINNGTLSNSLCWGYNGYIGINNTSPDYTLDVNGIARVRNVITYSNTTYSLPAISGVSNIQLSTLLGFFPPDGVYLVSIRSSGRENNVYYTVGTSFIVNYGVYPFATQIGTCVNNAITVYNNGGGANAYDITIQFNNNNGGQWNSAITLYINIIKIGS